jgi:hypothetical protein
VNKHKLLDSLHYRVRIWPIAARKIPGGAWLPPINDEWIVTTTDPRGIITISNPRTGHFAILGADRIHHFEHEPHRDWDGLRHGLFELRTQLVLSGNNVFYLPRQYQRLH